MVRSRMLVATVAAVLIAFTTAASAGVTVNPIGEGFVSPLQMAVGSDGTVYVSQSFIGALTTIDKKTGSHGDLVTANGSLGGVDANGKGTTVFTSGSTEEGFATLNRVQPNGKTSVLADLLGHESTNPDGGVTYGFVPALPADCAEEWPVDEAGPPTYTGQIDSHPYAVAIGNGEYYVADAGGNDIVRVGRNGRVSTVAVLPVQPHLITAQEAADNLLPPCVAGKTYNFEPVPTDVEIGRDGMLYVTTLPGGPEGPGLGARGSVYRVNPNSGESTRVATGFLGATNLAIDDSGTIYVAELFGGQVSKVVGSGSVPVISLTDPAGLEWADGKLYVSYNVFANGTIGTIPT